MKLLLWIIRFTIAAALLWLPALAPAIAQNVVHRGDITELGVEEVPYDSYTWELYNDSTVNFATAEGTAEADGDAEFVGGDTGPTVNVLWNEPGLYFVKVTSVDVSGCTNNLKIIMIRVLNVLPTGIIAAGPPVCEGEPIELTVTLTGAAPWSFTYTDGSTEWTVTDVMTETYVISIDPGPYTTTEYWITGVTDLYGTNSEPSERVEQQVNPSPESPIAENQSECEEFPVQTLTAAATAPEGATVVWYDALTGGTVVDSPTLSAVGSVTYYAESVLGDCISPTRTEVVLTIEPASLPTIAGPSPVCEIITGNTYTTQEGMNNYVWIVSPGGTITAGGSATDHSVTVTWNILGPQTVSVNYDNENGCSATTPAVLPVTVEPLPVTSPIWHY